MRQNRRFLASQILETQLDLLKSGLTLQSSYELDPENQRLLDNL